MLRKIINWKIIEKLEIKVKRINQESLSMKSENIAEMKLSKQFCLL